MNRTWECWEQESFAKGWSDRFVSARSLRKVNENEEEIVCRDFVGTFEEFEWPSTLGKRVVNPEWKRLPFHKYIRELALKESQMTLVGQIRNNWGVISMEVWMNYDQFVRRSHVRHVRGKREQGHSRRKYPSSRRFGQHNLQWCLRGTDGALLSGV